MSDSLVLTVCVDLYMPTLGISIVTRGPRTLNILEES